MIEKIEKFQILILAVIFATAGLIAASMVTKSMSNNSISVTGSYSQNVTSDSGLLEMDIHARKATKSAAFNALNEQQPIIINYLKKQGFKESEIELKSPNGYNVYVVTPNGMSTNKVEAYDASQRISVKSNDVQKIKKIATEISDLNSAVVDLNIYEPSYFYSKLSDLKVKMLEEAATDAKQRASAMLRPTHNKVGKIKSVKMGIFQVTPVDSNEVSDYGINDVSSIEKKVTSVANVTFGIK
ncbi:SIMPL domain-containing protein [bacterium]|nr:SIMPL domain-containing protein [bacterium]